METDPRAEWERLTRLYGQKGDEELLALAEDFGNLTEVAQQVLRDEMKRRRLNAPKGQPVPDNRPVVGGWGQTEKNPESDAGDVDSGDEEPDEPHEYTWKTVLCNCGSRKEAWQICEALRIAGIESWPDRPGSTFGTKTVASQSVRILVAADQLAEARDILARPIPKDIIDQSNEKVEDFVPPTCPKCGIADPLLESVDPSNNWRCENCGARWSDPLTVENAGQNPA